MRAQICRCGHDIDTHFEKSGACLGMLCNDCPCYRDPDEPDTLPRKRPVHPSRCKCYGCRNGLP